MNIKPTHDLINLVNFERNMIRLTLENFFKFFFIKNNIISIKKKLN